MIMEGMVACEPSLGVLSGDTVLVTWENLSATEEKAQGRSDIVALTETHIGERNTSIVALEKMIAEITHQKDEGEVGHSLPHQVIRQGDNHLVLIKTELNSQEKVAGIATWNIREKKFRIQKMMIMLIQSQGKKTNWLYLANGCAEIATMKANE